MAIVSSAEAGLLAAPGATILQLRAPELNARDLEREALRLVPSSPLPVLISSRCDVALASGAAGDDQGIRVRERLHGSKLTQGC